MVVSKFPFHKTDQESRTVALKLFSKILLLPSPPDRGLKVTGESAICIFISVNEGKVWLSRVLIPQ